MAELAIAAAPPDTTVLQARATLLGDRIDLKGLAHEPALALGPLTVRAGEAGLAVIFRYGALVTFDVAPAEEATLRAALQHLVSEPLEGAEGEQVAIAIRPGADDQVDPAGRITLGARSTPRLQVIADILAKHVVLMHHEARMAPVFDRLEPLAGSLRRTGRSEPAARLLLRQIGGVLQVQQKMVGRVEPSERPEVLWENPELERLHARLESEYELRDRSRALDRKLDFVFRSAETLLRLVEGGRALRVEWYVVILILIEILLMLWTIVMGP